MPDAAAPTTPPPAIDLEATFEASGVGPVLEQLDRELVGLLPVKRRIREVAALLLVDKLRRDLGLSAEQPTLHMSFTGTTRAPARPRWRRAWRASCTGWATSAPTTSAR